MAATAENDSDGRTSSLASGASKRRDWGTRGTRRFIWRPRCTRFRTSPQAFCSKSRVHAMPSAMFRRRRPGVACVCAARPRCASGMRGRRVRRTFRRRRQARRWSLYGSTIWPASARPAARATARDLAAWGCAQAEETGARIRKITSAALSDVMRDLISMMTAARRDQPADRTTALIFLALSRAWLRRFSTRSLHCEPRRRFLLAPVKPNSPSAVSGSANPSAVRARSLVTGGTPCRNRTTKLSRRNIPRTAGCRRRRCRGDGGRRQGGLDAAQQAERQTDPNAKGYQLTAHIAPLLRNHPDEFAEETAPCLVPKSMRTQTAHLPRTARARRSRFLGDASTAGPLRLLQRSAAGGGAALSQLPFSMMRKAQRPRTRPAERVEVKRTICTHCSVGCAIDAVVQNGVWIAPGAGVRFADQPWRALCERRFHYASTACTRFRTACARR